ncbi:ParB family protein [Enteractinococcus coprophilus]|uniref:ParB-like C-terminal domain-containing protein n=1 Tax=Enteractinococcus coprophilus TaxID=1027633 RepID=A0A543ANA8_9MICC|nr:hypothetical protein [Enteractinococcus coprophilus]TQL74062.1 hypothetical protein FB556_0513 [Enteractinococcus coprophilus]
MSEPLEHAMLFDLEPTQTAEKPVEQTVVAQDEDAAGQGALDIGIAIPTPFTEPEVDEEVEAEAEEVNEEVLQHPETSPRRHPNKVSFYQEPEDTARLRGAVLHTMVAEGHRSLSQFIIRAVMKEVQRVEDKYNDGKPFPAVAPNEMPQGRPQR